MNVGKEFKACERFGDQHKKTSPAQSISFQKFEHGGSLECSVVVELGSSVIERVWLKAFNAWEVVKLCMRNTGVYATGA